VIYKRFTRLSILLLVTVLVLLPGGAVAQDGVGLEVIRISDNIHKIVCSAGFTSNCLVVTGPDGLLLVDTGMQATAQLLVDTLNAMDAGPVRYVLHTHSHSDHTGANPLLGEEATIVAHDSFERAYKTGFGLLTEFPPHAYPDVTFLKTHSLEFNGEKIEMTYFRFGHSEGDAIVSFEKSGLVCMGGLLASDQFPYLDLRNGGDIREYTKTLFKIIYMFPEMTRFIPSHGRDYTRAELTKYREMVLATTAVVQAGLDAGKDIETMQAEDVLVEWDSWGGGFVSKDLWIQTVATSLTGENPPQKKVVFEPLYYTAKQKDATAAIEQYHDLKKNHPDDYDFGEASLNALGYYFIGKERYDEAIEVFTLNVDLFPESANPYDSLGEAYMKKGDVDQAIKYYSKALEINPLMPSAIQALKQLQAQ
jgi:cyclase